MSSKEVIAIGLDIENTERFRNNKSKSFIRRTFSQAEIEYCEKQSDPDQHYCARFAAKEATLKALSQIGINISINKKISIIKNDDNLPELHFNDNAIKHEDKELFSELSFIVSLTHTKTIGAAVVLITKKI